MKTVLSMTLLVAVATGAALILAHQQGKRLDPKEFWKDRVVWCDASALRAAQEKGRRFPPIPYEDANFRRFSDRDEVIRSFGVERSGPSYRGSYRERVFWDSFARTHPKPPEILDRELAEFARRILTAPSITGLSPKEITDLQRSIRGEALSLGYPKEALSDEALFWIYVMSQRQQYQKLIRDGWKPNTVPVNNLLNTPAVNSKYVTDPLTPDQSKAAVSWKWHYLQRLRKEGIDESYIKAYLGAWNLSEVEAFSEPKAM